MKKYTVKNGCICYDGKEVYALDRRQNAEVICECAQNVHLYLLENADISLLSKDCSIFDLRIFSCNINDLPYIEDAFAELNHDLKTEPDEEDYFVIENNPYLTPCNGDVLIKWDMKSHSYKCYDMSALDLKDLHDLLIFG